MTNFSAAIEEAERAAARDGSIFAGKYLQYSRLKAIIEKDVQRSLLDESQSTNKRHISMSIPEPPPGYEFNPAFEAAVRFSLSSALPHSLGKAHLMRHSSPGILVKSFSSRCTVEECSGV